MQTAAHPVIQFVGLGKVFYTEWVDTRTRDTVLGNLEFCEIVELPPTYQVDVSVAYRRHRGTRCWKKPAPR